MNKKFFSKLEEIKEFVSKHIFGVFVSGLFFGMIISYRKITFIILGILALIIIIVDWFTNKIRKRNISLREEANALICHCVRNGFIEDLHAGKHSKLLENPKYSRITDEEMKKIMIEASAKLETLFAFKEKEPEKYWHFIEVYNKTYAGNWDKKKRTYKIKKNY